MTKRSAIETVVAAIRVPWETAGEHSNRWEAIMENISGMEAFLIYSDEKWTDELRDDIHFLWSIALMRFSMTHRSAN